METATPKVEPTATPAIEMEIAMPTAEPTASAVLTLEPESFEKKNVQLGKFKYLAGGMRIPVLYQYNYKTVVATCGDEDISVATSGCGATALSMVIAYLTGEKSQTPYTLFRRRLHAACTTAQVLDKTGFLNWPRSMA
jgi:hypothetical protein